MTPRPLGPLKRPPELPSGVVRAVPSRPPDLRPPLFAVLWTGGWAVFWLVLALAMLSVGLAFWCVFSLATLAPSLAWYRRRLAQRLVWRRARGVAWLFKPPLPAPECTDWDAYERDLNPEW
jgi:hypothetical protein